MRLPALIVALVALVALVAGCPAAAQGLYVAPTPVDLSTLATKVEVQAAQAAATSAATAAAAANTAPARTPICSVPAIPTGNNVTNTNAETQFVTACRYPAGMIMAGTSTRVDSRFLFGVSATIPALRGRVLLARTTTPNLSTCVANSQCVVLLDTGSVAGLAAGQNLYANADVSLTFQTAQSVEAAGQLNFKTTATAVIAIGVTSANSPADGALTIPWDTASFDTYLVYAATWSAASSQNYIQMRQQTVK